MNSGTETEKQSRLRALAKRVEPEQAKTAEWLYGPGVGPKTEREKGDG